MISGTKTEMSISSVYAVKKATYDGNMVGLIYMQQPWQRVTNTLGKSLLPVKKNFKKVFGTLWVAPLRCSSKLKNFRQINQSIN
jgi:hypothetical protein